MSLASGYTTASPYTKYEEKIYHALPKNHLPRWVEYERGKPGGGGLPLPVGKYKHHGDYGPITLTINKLAKSIYTDTPEDFDTRLLPREILTYKSERDPHMKAYFKKPRIKKHMQKQGLITPSGDVFCSLKEFNTYRKYLEDRMVFRGNSLALQEKELQFPQNKFSFNFEQFELERQKKFQDAVRMIAPFHGDMRAAMKQYELALAELAYYEKTGKITPEEFDRLYNELIASKRKLDKRVRLLDEKLQWLENQETNYQIDKCRYIRRLREKLLENIEDFENRKKIQDIMEEEENFKKLVMHLEFQRRQQDRADQDSHKHLEHMKDVYARLLHNRNNLKKEALKNIDTVVKKVTKARHGTHGKDCSARPSRSSLTDDDVTFLKKYLKDSELDEKEFNVFMTDVFSVNWRDAHPYADGLAQFGEFQEEQANQLIGLKRHYAGCDCDCAASVASDVFENSQCSFVSGGSQPVPFSIGSKVCRLLRHLPPGARRSCHCRKCHTERRQLRGGCDRYSLPEKLPTCLHNVKPKGSKKGYTARRHMSTPKRRPAKKLHETYTVYSDFHKPIHHDRHGIMSAMHSIPEEDSSVGSGHSKRVTHTRPTANENPFTQVFAKATGIDTSTLKPSQEPPETKPAGATPAPSLMVSALKAEKSAIPSVNPSPKSSTPESAELSASQSSATQPATSELSTNKSNRVSIMPPPPFRRNSKKSSSSSEKTTGFKSPATDLVNNNASDESADEVRNNNATDDSSSEPEKHQCKLWTVRMSKNNRCKLPSRAMSGISFKADFDFSPKNKAKPHTENEHQHGDRAACCNAQKPDHLANGIEKKGKKAVLSCQNEQQTTTETDSPTQDEQSSMSNKESQNTEEDSSKKLYPLGNKKKHKDQQEESSSDDQIPSKFRGVIPTTRIGEDKYAGFLNEVWASPAVNHKCGTCLHNAINDMLHAKVPGPGGRPVIAYPHVCPFYNPYAKKPQDPWNTPFDSETSDFSGALDVSLKQHRNKDTEGLKRTPVKNAQKSTTEWLYDLMTTADQDGKSSKKPASTKTQSSTKSAKKHKKTSGSAKKNN